jgi:hypothetical protein
MLAACHKTYDHRFFGGKRDQNEVIELYCVNCVVKQNCTMFKIEREEFLGTWGGRIGKTNSKDE